MRGIFAMMLVLLFFLTGCDVMDSWQNPSLAVSEEEIDLGPAGVYAVFQIANQGGGSLDWEVTSSADWLKITPTEGKQDGLITVQADREQFRQEEEAVNKEGEIRINSNGGLEVLPVTLEHIPADGEKKKFLEWKEDREMDEEFLVYDQENFRVFTSYVAGTDLILALEDRELEYTEEEIYRWANNFFNYFYRTSSILGQHPLDEVRVVVRNEKTSRGEITAGGWESLWREKLLISLKDMKEIPLARNVISLWWGNIVHLSDEPEDSWLQEGYREYLALAIQNDPEQAMARMVKSYEEEIGEKGALSMAGPLDLGSDGWESDMFRLASGGFFLYLNRFFKEDESLLKLAGDPIARRHDSPDAEINSSVFKQYLEPVLDLPEEFSSIDDIFEKFLGEEQSIPLEESDDE